MASKLLLLIEPNTVPSFMLASVRKVARMVTPAALPLTAPLLASPALKAVACQSVVPLKRLKWAVKKPGSSLAFFGGLVDISHLYNFLSSSSDGDGAYFSISAVKHNFTVPIAAAMEMWNIAPLAP